MFTDKTHLAWTEPKGVRKAIYKIDNRFFTPFVKLVIFGIVTGIFMLAWWYHSDNPNRYQPSKIEAIGFSLIGSFAFVYLIPWLMKHCPTTVRISESGISRQRGNSISDWSYKHINYCEITPIQTENCSDYVLVVNLNNSKRVMLGLPLDKLEETKQILTQMNVVTKSGAQQSHLADG